MSIITVTSQGVGNAGHKVTLREAVAEAAGSDTIVFAGKLTASGGGVQLHSNLDISKSITIDGSGGTATGLGGEFYMGGFNASVIVGGRCRCDLVAY